VLRFDNRTRRRTVVRAPPVVHARAAALAQVEGKSLDIWAQEVFVQAASRPHPAVGVTR
jgi:predicted HicB family RNase H-like nuclease